MKAYQIVFPAFFLLMASFFSCHQPPEPYPGFKYAEPGIYYQFHHQSETGIRPDTGDMLTLSLRWYSEDTTIYFDTHDLPGEFSIIMEDPRTSMDLFTCLKMMRLGDSATFILPPDSLLGYELLEDTASIILLDVKILNIVPREEHQATLEKERQENKDRERSEVEKFLEEHNIRSKTTSSGIHIFNHEKKPANPPVEAGKVVMLTFKGRLLNGDVFQETSPEFAYVVGESPHYPIDWDEGLLEMRKGEKATMLLPFDLALGSEGAEGLIPPYSPIIMEVWINDVISKQEYQQMQLSQGRDSRQNAEREMKEYLRKHEITQEPTASGLVYITQKAGTGPYPQPGETVQVHYTGYMLNGEVFDSSHNRGVPLEVVIGQGGLIQGWLEALPMMRQGEKAKVIIPWQLAYGRSGKGNIPPFANLVFEMELINII